MYATIPQMCFTAPYSLSDCVRAAGHRLHDNLITVRNALEYTFPPADLIIMAGTVFTNTANTAP